MLRYRLVIGLLVLAVAALLVVLLVLAVRPIGGGAGGPVPAGPGADEPSSPSGVPGDAEQAVVTDHVDGDTLRVLGSAGSSVLGGDETTVRLLEIDTPESVAPGSPVECYAERAGAALADLAPVGSEVWVAADVELLDPFGRTLLYLWNEDGVFVNLEMVETGHARAVLYEPNDEHIELMRRAERRSRAAGVGLWGTCER